MKPLRIIRSAELEFHEALAWYQERNQRVGERFAVEARRTLHLIEEFPQIGARVPGLDDHDVRRMPIHTFPYHIIFVDLRDRLEVVAFAHNRRRPAYFIRRLSRA